MSKRSMKMLGEALSLDQSVWVPPVSLQVPKYELVFTDAGFTLVSDGDEYPTIKGE